MDNNKTILMLLDNAFNPDLRVQKEINTLIKLGYSVELICWDQEGELPEYEQKPNFIVRRLKIIAEKQKGIKKIFDLFEFSKRAVRKIKSLNNDYFCIYAHDFLMLPLGVYLKRILNRRIIFDAHEIYHLMEWEKYPPPIRKIIFLTERLLLNFVDEMIVVNKKRKEFYSEYYKEKEIKIIGNWYDPYDGDAVSLRKEYSIPENGVLLSYFGVVNFDERPIDKIINSVSDHTNLHFFVAGVGKHDAKISEMSASNERLYYMGWQKNIRRYLNDIDFIVYYLNDSRKYFQYTAPNTLYMAISHNIPLITNVPGEAEELISNFNIGYFVNSVSEFKEKVDFDPHSKINKDKRDAISKIKNQFEWASNEEKYINILNSIRPSINS